MYSVLIYSLIDFMRSTPTSILEIFLFLAQSEIIVYPSRFISRGTDRYNKNDPTKENEDNNKNKVRNIYKIL